MNDKNLSARMDVVERLTQLFSFERRVYLAITVVSLVMLMISAVSLMLKGQAGAAELSMLFGSSGLITYSTGRLIFMWHEALKRLIPDGASNEQE